MYRYLYICQSLHSIRSLTERKAIIPSFEGKHYSSSFCITHVVFAVQFCITLVVLLVVRRSSTESRASEAAIYSFIQFHSYNSFIHTISYSGSFFSSGLSKTKHLSQPLHESVRCTVAFQIPAHIQCISISASIMWKDENNFSLRLGQTRGARSEASSCLEAAFLFFFAWLTNRSAAVCSCCLAAKDLRDAKTGMLTIKK